MTANITNLKTQVQGRIDAANSSTTLKDLLIIRKAAEGLGCNEASLDALITTALDAMSGATPLKDLLIGNKASDLVGQGFKNKVQITSSQNWTVPAGVYSIEIRATGAGGSGGKSNANTVNSGGSGGGGAGGTGFCILNVTPSQVIEVIIGAGGVGTTTGSQSGGNTLVTAGNLPVLAVTGGFAGQDSSGTGAGGSAGTGGEPRILFRSAAIVKGGNGGNGSGNSSAGISGFKPVIFDITGANPLTATTSTGTAGGTGGSNRFAGGGGGSSIYGNGGAGANGVNIAGAAIAGGNAPTTSYGAGGGGASGIGSSAIAAAAGGNGANGIVEIFY